MKYNLDQLNEYVEKGLLDRQTHPNLPLFIYKYTRSCQYGRLWDDITINMRGTVVDNKGNRVAATLPKFFNIEEMPNSIPDEEFEVFDKLDGSLGIGFFYDGEFVIATSGSFASKQAERAKEIMKKYRMTLLNDKDLYEATGFKFNGNDLTLLWEIIYPENRIVVDYGGMEELVLIGAIHTESGIECDYNELVGIGDVLGMPVVKRHLGFKDVKELKKAIPDNAEGFVIKFKDLRMKVKSEEYVRLHRLLTECSSIDIWECLLNGKTLDEFLDRVPDEFDEWIRRNVAKLEANYKEIEDDGLDFYRREIEGKGYSFKEVSEILNEKATPFQKSLIFSIVRGNDYSQMIWKKIRPAYQKPFWCKEEI